MHILRKPLVYYDKIHFYTPNQHQDKIVSLKTLMDDISEKVGYNVLELHGRMTSWIHQNIQATTEKWSSLMILSMLLTKFNQKLPIIGQMEDIMEFLQFIFLNPSMMFPKRSN